MSFVKPNNGEAAPGGGGPFVLAHLSDPHLSSLAGVSPAALLNKRLLGYLSWFRRRRHIHSPHVLEALLCDLAEVAPDQIAVTGDLTHLGLPEEFRQVARWLERLGQPERVVVVPGNHDSYVAAPWGDTYGAWEPYLAGDGGSGGTVYPTLRVRGQVALIGLSSARPSPPLLAVGSLGRRQLAALDRILEETGRRGLLRVVLLHHPPLAGSIAWRKRLTDATPFARTVARRGAELIIHGHAHLSMAGELPSAGGKIPVFGVPSASDCGGHPLRSGRYNLYRFERRAGSWALLLTVRAYSRGEGRFVTAREEALPLPGAC